MDQFETLSRTHIVPAEVSEVMRRLRELYGQELDILSASPDWIRLRRKATTDTHFMKDLMYKEKQIFEKDQIHRFQVLCPFDERSGRGVEIHYLGHRRHDYRPGYWWI